MGRRRVAVQLVAALLGRAGRLVLGLLGRLVVALVALERRPGPLGAAAVARLGRRLEVVGRQRRRVPAVVEAHSSLNVLRAGVVRPIHVL
jgi:hypothetical protein